METSANNFMDALTEGKVIGPAHHRFSLKKKLGVSALGQLWQAEDLSVQGTPLVSLEIIASIFSPDPQALEAIKRQVSYGKRLKHKHILQNYGFFNESKQRAFISSERLDGTSLATLLQEGKIRKLSCAQIKGLLLQTATALDTAYSTQRISHNALCPALLFINRGTGVKVTGFGLDKALDNLPDSAPHSQRYNIYQAPETHISGNHSRQSDIYSLACIAYEVLTGHPPFASTTDPGQCDPTRLSQPKSLSDQQWAQLQSALSSGISDRPATALKLIKSLFQPDTQIPESREEPATDNAADTALSVTETTTAESMPGKKQLRLPSVKLNRPLSFALGLLTGICAGIAAAFFYLTNQQEGQIANGTLPVAEALTKQVITAQPAPPDQDSTSEMMPDNPDAFSTSGAEPAAEDDLSATKLLNLQLAEVEAPRTLVFRDQIKKDLYGPDMVALPFGKFQMGDSHKLGDDNEYPVHQVSIHYGVALSRYEITFAQYDAFARATGRKQPDDEGWGRGTRPVINVRWRDAQAYSQWLAQETGQPYRLPTEAEWEYAARAGTTTAFWWGNKSAPGYAVCDECGSDWDGVQTAPVGSLKANPWGFHDMAGNVNEWVADCYQPDYQGAPDDGSALSTTGCGSHVMRGGSWFDIDRLIRPAGRYRHDAGAKQNDWGFRVALDMPASEGD
ncbi:MAG: SUMF1/EgtB/PvdO family nonheme iron enzyme [Pontibacterium sp.]